MQKKFEKIRKNAILRDIMHEKGGLICPEHQNMSY